MAEKRARSGENAPSLKFGLGTRATVKANAKHRHDLALNRAKEIKTLTDAAFEKALGNIQDWQPESAVHDQIDAALQRIETELTRQNGAMDALLDRMNKVAA